MLLQTLVELGVGLAVTADPYRILDQDGWFGVRDGSIVIIAMGPLWTPAPTLLHSGEGYVAVSRNDVAVVGCYVSPYRGLSSCELNLEELGGFLSVHMARPLPVLREISAHSVAWGSPGTDARVRSALVGWSEELEVSREELGRAVVWMGAWRTAPGPDGIPGRAFALALEAWGDRVRRLFYSCLRTGRFPACWKRARVVLIPKLGKATNSPKAFRPVCMLDEVGKLFERVLVARLQEHLTDVGPYLSVSQYGFRHGRSTIDSNKRVRSLSEAAVDRGGVLLPVGVDIASAFNTLPGAAIR
ncbi:PREDICTED: uncharacterized protein LOC108552105, partial [Eufriesea mexicana]|uniref:uncharacterized protein LOC108552105 n=1 Tax=Eufriesea mexicana TaxID=516756 RepID=UPI00083BA768